jgi:hypothetical protein
VPLLTAAEPIDRLRYQAVLVFDHFDADKAGRLTADQVQQFLVASARKVSVEHAGMPHHLLLDLTWQRSKQPGTTRGLSVSISQLTVPRCAMLCCAASCRSPPWRLCLPAGVVVARAV